MTGERGSGRTTAMLKQIPTEGALVIVHSSKAVAYVEALIRHVRGAEIAAATRVRAIERFSDVDRVLAGTWLPVLVDHAFDEYAPARLCNLVHDIIRARQTAATSWVA